MLNALRDARAHKIAHGDVKSENILVTSWNWVYLTDFASHKPTFLPLDDPSDFAFYFDTSGRRSCYIAPERFFASGARLDGVSPLGEADRENKDARVTEAMDVFSAGCVIAELFRDGAPLFTLSQLFKYREGELHTDGLLSSVEDVGVRVSHMWSRGVSINFVLLTSFLFVGSHQGYDCCQALGATSFRYVTPQCPWHDFPGSFLFFLARLRFIYQ